MTVDIFSGVTSGPPQHEAAGIALAMALEGLQQDAA
jgi:hypothetical protein